MAGLASDVPPRLRLAQCCAPHQSSFRRKTVPSITRELKACRDAGALLRTTVEACGTLLAAWSRCAAALAAAGLVDQLGVRSIERALRGVFSAARLPPQYRHGLKLLLYGSLVRMEQALRTTGEAGSLGPVEAGCVDAVQVIGGGPMLEELVVEVLHKAVEDEVARHCRGEYATPVLDALHEWRCRVMEPWVDRVVAGASARDMRQQAEVLLHHVFVEARISELFEVITDFPDSATAVNELRVALGRARLQGRLASALGQAFRQRLLHPGATTNQVIDVYINTVKALRLLDPTDQLLDTVAKPLRLYLRQRPDTVRCIVEALVDAGGGDLAAELQRGSQAAQAAPDPLLWTPPAWDADVSAADRSGADILTLFVSIYGSKKLFVEEYRAMLADKLLGQPGTDADREVANLELLKIRFGDEALVDCEIMIRDVEESRRLATQLRSARGDTPVEATVLSHHYWPPLRREDLALHADLQEPLEAFGAAYTARKTPRKLMWYTDVGVVDIGVDFDDGSHRRYSVAPLAATVLMHLAEKDSGTREDLATTTNASLDHVGKALAHWVAEGVVEAVPGEADAFRVLPAPREVDGGAVEAAREGWLASDAKSAEEEATLASYVIGMLKNLKSLPLRRIQQLLRTYMQGAYEGSAADLSRILARLIQEEKVEYVDGEYQLS